MQFFNIQVASQLSGVACATIRAWEKRYNAVNPERGENKHRLYSEHDIEKLAILYRLTELGQSIGKIAHLELNKLKEVYATLTHRPYDEREMMTIHHDRIDTSRLLSNLQLSLSGYKLDILSHELEKALNTLSPRELCLNVLVPLFQEIGTKVSRGEFSIAQEHTLSALVKFYIGQTIGQHYQRAIKRKELILIATPESEFHEIGILCGALLCVHYGIRFVYLGANLPAASLAETANALQPSAILIGSTRYELTSKLSFDDYLNSLRRMLSVKPHLWVGGELKQYLVEDPEKKNIEFFSTLQTLDEYLSSFQLH